MTGHKHNGGLRRMYMRTLSGIALAAMLGVGVSASYAQGALEGSSLIGQLEGAEVHQQDIAFPNGFGESPDLAALVAAGDLPPVEERLPKQPLVLQTLEEIGTYGGTWRTAFTGPGDSEAGNRVMASDRVLSWDYTGSTLVPSVARDWEISEDGKQTTIYLREGMKWSNGDPFTADDFVFWYEDIYKNTEIGGPRIQELQVAGTEGRVVKVDDYTVRFEFEGANFLLVEQFAAQGNMGGQTWGQNSGRSLGPYAPASYLKQFHPDYTDPAKVDELARAAGYENWVQHFHFLKDWRLNTDAPVLGPWKTVQPINSSNWVLERNPYYWMVDTEGNQLPYIDRVSFGLAEDLEVVNLRAIAGEYDYQQRHLQLAKLPVLLENQERGDYKVHIDLATYGSDLVLHMNMSYTADEEIGKWLRNVDFRRALSLGIDRDQLNETFWIGLGTPGSPVVADESPENPGPEWRNMWSTYQPDEANRMLDAIGLDKRDSEGYRVRTDNGERLVLQAAAVQSLQPYPQQLEMVAQQWKEIGIALDVRETERSLAFTRMLNNELQIFPFSNSGSEKMFLVPHYVVPVDPSQSNNGPEFARWYVSGGTEGMAPEDPHMIEVYDLFRKAPAVAEDERNKIAQEIWKIVVDQQWSIGVVGVSPGSFGTRVVSNQLVNSPERSCVANQCRTPSSAYPQQFFFR